MKSFRVLQSFSRPGPDDNPYISLTVNSVGGEAKVAYFSWRTALLGRYDVFHLHWLDPLVYGPSRASMLLHWMGSAALILRLRVTRTPVVRTVHNKEVRGQSRWWPVRHIVREFERLAAVTITMNRVAAGSAQPNTVMIPHGHYGPWFRQHPIPASVPGRLLTFGLLRAYKGTEALVSAFARTDQSATPLELHVVGRVVDVEVAVAVEEVARIDRRLTFVKGHASDLDLAREVGESELVVLPYDDLFNSGCVLLTLSLGRPVLVPRCEAAEELSEEFGSAWVLLYDAPLTPQDLVEAARQAATEDRLPLPDLSRREWSAIGASTLAVYQQVSSRRNAGAATGARRR